MMGTVRFRPMVAAIVCCSTGALALAAPAAALEPAPQWTVTAVARPTDFSSLGSPGYKAGEDAYIVEVKNTGDAPSEGPVTIEDELPKGVSLDPSGASGEDALAEYLIPRQPPNANFMCVLRSCTYAASVVPDDTLTVTFPVDVEIGVPSQVRNVVRVSGGGAPDAATVTPTRIGTGPAGFGLAGGGATTVLSNIQAGAHPDITTSIAFNTRTRGGGLAGDFKDTTDELPPGFASDFADTPSCPAVFFNRSECPIPTQIGVTTIDLAERGTIVEPVYNLAPNPGDIAKLGFSVGGDFNIQGEITVRPDGGADVSFDDTFQGAEVDSVSLTVWGVPTDAVHDVWRWKAEGVPPLGHFGVSSDAPRVPFFTNPTVCSGEPLLARFEVNSWEEPENVQSAQMEFGPLTGCDRLTIRPSLTAVATTPFASSATGLDVGLSVPQTYNNADGLATSALEKATVTLPEGMTVNPSAGAGLEGCTEAELQAEAAQYSPTEGCPKESKLGSIKIKTPVLNEEASGSVFLASPAPRGEAGRNPFDSLLALYIVARFPDRGIIVKAAGEVKADPLTGRLVTTFDTSERAVAGGGFALVPHDGLPPLPFSLFTFQFHQGATSPLVTPSACGEYAVQALLSPSSAPTDVLPALAPPFAIIFGVGGGPCPSSGVPPFEPQVISGTQNNSAAFYSPFYLRIVRSDGEQELTGFTTVLPPGLTANLTGVPFCSDSAIEAARHATGKQETASPSCPAASEIGHTLVGAGVGSVLAWTPGKVYLAGPYHGSALSIVSVTSATVGPFDLGTVVIRFALRINPITGQAEIDGSGSDPIPHILDGILVHVRDIHVYVDRPNFILNPTDCERMSIQDTITGAGADPATPADQMPVTVSTPFQAADCQALRFKPIIKVSTSGRTSRARGASLRFKLSYPRAPQGSQANIRSVRIELPKQLPSRLLTLQKACADVVFDTDPAGCPPASRVGQARAITPVLPVPLSGPAYFVSHGGAKFPELVIVLQGYGITIDLRGETFINRRGITSSTFRSVPDQPVDTFELKLPQGPYSALAANGDLCRSRLRMPAVFTAQNGRTLRQAIPIGVSGCMHKRRSLRHRAKGG